MTIIFDFDSGILNGDLGISNNDLGILNDEFDIFKSDDFFYYIGIQLPPLLPPKTPPILRGPLITEEPITEEPMIISNICFCAKSLVYTDQGVKYICDIEPNKYTINNNKIIAISKTITLDKQLQ